MAEIPTTVRLGDWTTCSDSECSEWKTCTKAHACLSKTMIPDAILERVGRAIADIDQEDYMEDCVIYDKRAVAALRAYEQEKSIKETRRRIPAHDVETIKVCVAGAWAHGTISGGRARELARSCGWDENELEVLKIAEERETADGTR